MNKLRTAVTVAAAIGSMAIGSPTLHAADQVKIGFITTLTTGAASIGKDQENAVNLALEHIDNKICLLYTSPSPRDS